MKLSAVELRTEPWSQIQVLTCRHIKPVLPSTSANWFTLTTWWTSKTLPGQLFNKGRDFMGVGWEMAHLGCSRFYFISCQIELLLLLKRGVKKGNKWDEIYVISQLVRTKQEVDKNWGDLVHSPAFEGDPPLIFSVQSWGSPTACPDPGWCPGSHCEMQRTAYNNLNKQPKKIQLQKRSKMMENTYFPKGSKGAKEGRRQKVGP